MRSVCFLMLYHGRPELTKMSLLHLSNTAWLFEDEGFRVKTMVVGDSKEIRGYCEDHGLHHETFKNYPLAHKMTYAWIRAMQQNTDYICWLGSNNVHGQGYWEVCMNRLNSNLCATFGTRNCVITSTKAGEDKTYLFHPSEGYLISAGQFFLRHSLYHSVNFLTVFDDDQTFAFDGSILDAMTSKWGQDIIEVVSFDEEDCLDIKGDENIHSYESYANAGYREYINRDELRGRHFEFSQLL